MGPSTAQVRRVPALLGPEGRSRVRQRLQRGAHRLGVRVVGVVDHRDAVRAVDDLHPPPRRGPAADSAAATPLRGGPALQRDRRGGQGVADVVRPTSRSATSAEPCGVTSRNRGRPAASVRSSARTVASGDRPTVTTRARVRVAMAATAGSSALSTATPSAGSASTSSPFASAIASGEPNSPRCARPTLSTTPIRGCATWHSAAMCPRPRAESSSTRWRVAASARSAVQGRPSSLLNDPGGATVGPSGARTAASRSFVDVLPELPVTPTTVRPASLSTATLCAASRASAARTAAPEPSGSVAAR